MRRSLLSLPVALMALTLLLGCPSGTPPEKTDPADPEGTPEVETPSADIPELYRFPLGAIIPTLDPALLTDSVSSAVVGQIFDGLLKISPDGELVPALAESWSVEDEGRRLVFKLRSGVKFHNGREMTAEDVKYSFNRVLNPATLSPKTLFLDPLAGAADVMSGKAPEATGIVVKSPTELELLLDRPNSLFPWYLAQSTCTVVPKEVVEDTAQTFANNPVGTGPFKFTAGSYNPNEGIKLEANPDYFLGAPKIKGIQYVVESEPKKRFEGFKAGLYEHTDIPAEEVEAVMGDPAMKAMLVEKATFDLYNIAFNCDKAPFKDNPTLRQALNYAVDKEFIANTLLKRSMVVANGFLPNDFPNYTVPHTAYPYDVTMATDLLTKAGYPGGEGLPSITLWCNTDETRIRIMEAVQGDLAKIGVKVELKTLEWASFLEAMDRGEHEMGQATWLMDYPDPDNILYVLFHSKNKGPAGNQAFYGNPDVDAWVEEAQVIADPATRKSLYEQAEAQLYADAPWLLLLNNKCLVLRQPYVQGLNLTRLDRAPQIPGVDFETVEFK